MDKEELLKKLAAELEGKPPAWNSGFKLAIVHLGKLFEEDAGALKDGKKTKEYMAYKRKDFLSNSWKWQRSVEIENMGKGFDYACNNFAKLFREQKDWKKEDRSALYDAILVLFSIPILEERKR